MLCHKDICVSQALVRDKYRRRILEAIPAVEFVWVDAPEDLILSRLENRAGHVAGKGYGVMVNRIFEMPTVAHVRFENGDDPAQFDAQLKAIFGRK
jgi:gluconate kinase